MSETFLQRQVSPCFSCLVDPFLAQTKVAINTEFFNKRYISKKTRCFAVQKGYVLVITMQDCFLLGKLRHYKCFSSVLISRKKILEYNQIKILF